MELLEGAAGVASHLGLVLLVAADDVLQSGRTEEVLLLETKLLALHHLRGEERVRQASVQVLLSRVSAHVVIGVEHSCDVLGQVAVQHCLDVVAVVDCTHTHTQEQGQGQLIVAHSRRGQSCWGTLQTTASWCSLCHSCIQGWGSRRPWR